MVSLAREGEHAVLAVRDNGIGIEPRQLDTVFDLFVQGHDQARARRRGPGIGPVAGEEAGRAARRQRRRAERGRGAAPSSWCACPWPGRQRALRPRRGRSRSLAPARGACWWWTTIATPRNRSRRSSAPSATRSARSTAAPPRSKRCRASDRTSSCSISACRTWTATKRRGASASCRAGVRRASWPRAGMARLRARRAKPAWTPTSR